MYCFRRESVFLYHANLEKDAGVSLQIFLSERFLIVIKLIFYVGNDKSLVNRFLLLLYKKFTMFRPLFIMLKVYHNC